MNRSIRSALLIVPTILLMSLLGTVWQLMFGRLMPLDIPLLLVLYLALGRESKTPSICGRPSSSRLLVSSDVVVVLVVGYLADLLAASPKGLHGLALGVVYLLARLVRHRLDFGAASGRTAVAFAASLVFSAVLLLAQSWSTDLVRISLIVPVGLHAVATAVLVSPLVRLFSSLEAKLQGNPFGSALIDQ